MRLPVKAGLRTVGVTFLRESPKAEAEAPPTRLGGASGGGSATSGDPPAEMDLRSMARRYSATRFPSGSVPEQTWLGDRRGWPYKRPGRGDTPSREGSSFAVPLTPQMKSLARGRYCPASRGAPSAGL